MGVGAVSARLTGSKISQMLPTDACARTGEQWQPAGRASTTNHVTLGSAAFRKLLSE